MKKCSKCEEILEECEFHKDKQKSDGLYPSCKSCMSKIYTTKEYKEVRKHPRYAKIKRDFKVKSFGISVEEYEKMIELQENKCAICDVHHSELNKLLSVDHNHSTGKVRGLLCVRCNFGIGYFKENIKILERAIEYVVKNS